MAVGDGRNDGNNSIYTGTNDGKVFEFRYNSTSGDYDMIDMGRYSAFCSSPVTCGHEAYRNFISLGNARNDSFGNRIYSVVSENYHAYEYTWNATNGNWTIIDMGNVSSDAHLTGNDIGQGRNDSVNRFYIASMSPFEFRTSLINTFNDSETDHTLYANGTSFDAAEKLYINVPKNASVSNAGITMSKVDLGIANYDPNYNLYTANYRNGTDEIIAAGTKGYIAVMNKTTGNIIQEIDNSISGYIIDSDFQEDGSEAIMITQAKNVLLYDANAKTITAHQPTGLSYLTGVSYSHDDSYAIITSGASDPIVFYNTSSGTFSDLSTQAGSTRCSKLSSTKDEAIICTANAIYWFNVSCAMNSFGTDNFPGSCSQSLSSFTGSTSGKVCDVDFKPDGSEALLVCMNGVVKRYIDSSRTIQSLSINTSNDLKGVSYSASGDRAIIVGESGTIFLYNSSTQSISNLSSQYKNNTNAVVFINDTDAVIVGSGRSALKYNSQYNGVTANISIMRSGSSGILYHLAFKPNTAEALIAADDGQIFKYNLSSNQMTTLNSPVNIPFLAVEYNWNGSEALIVGKAGTVLKFNSSDSSFTTLNTSVTSSLTSVSYRNATNEALIGGTNNTLLIKNSTCDGITNPLCKLTLNGNAYEKTTVAFNPSGTIAIIGQLCYQFIYNSTTGSIEGGLRWHSDGCAKTRGIAWKPDGTEALLVGRINNETCEDAGYLSQIVVYNASANNFTGAKSCIEKGEILEDISYSSDGSEALIVGQNGILLKYNTTNPDYSNLKASLTDLSSGTTGTLFSVDYRRDGIANEALLVAGDNKQVLFYDGEKVLTDPEVWLNDTRIFYEAGTYNKDSSLINFTANLTSYLSSCSEKADGTCDVPFWVNSSSTDALMKLHDINITYTLNSSITSVNTIYEYSFNSSSNGWNISSLPTQSEGFYAVAVGKGRNSTTYRVYGANEDAHGYEYTWNSTAGNWSVLDMGALASSALYDVFVGDGRDDNTIRVYFASQNGRAYEYSWDGSNNNYTITDMGRLGKKIYGVGAGDGRNDAKIRLYSSDKSYQISEAAYNAGSWSLVRVGATTNRGYYSDDVKIIDVKNDDVMRIYSTRTDGSLYVNEFFTGFDDPIHLYEDYLSGNYIINFTWGSASYIANPLFAEMFYSQNGEYEELIEHIDDVKNSSLCTNTDFDEFNRTIGGYCLIPWDTTFVPDGKQYFLINRMNDGIHSIQEQSKEFMIDNTPPFSRGFEENPKSNTGYIKHTSYTFMIDYYDATSGINLVKLNFNGSEYEAELKDGKYQVDIPDIFIGEYDYYQTAVDNVGNSYETEINSYRVNIIYSVSPEKQVIKTFNGFTVDFSQLSYDPNNLTYEWLLDGENISFNKEWTYSVLYDIGEHNVTINVYDNDIPFNDTHSWTVDVWLQGDTDHDVEGDYDVDIFDLAKIGLYYGCSSDEGGWLDCENADVNLDNKVDILDLATVGYYYGVRYEE
ncbi:MAG: hypothetical protein KAU20_06800 [Nanoarchaeota archaeon]|nr:hypothetical protein [Nanoarchaeota archaeon]